MVVVILVFVIGRLDFPGWVLRGISGLVPPTGTGAYTPEEIQELRDRLGALESENALLRERIVRLQDEEEIGKADIGEGYETVTAHVIYRDHSRMFDTAVIDRGTVEGIEVGMPVVDSRGLVGRIVASRAAISRIVLVTSSDCAFGVVDQRSRELGIVRGSDPVKWRSLGNASGNGIEIPPNVLELEYLSPSADISVHDTLVTSGLSGITPSGIRVGEVVEIVSHEEQDWYDIRVRPFADLDHLETVAVVLYGEEERVDLGELLEESGEEIGSLSGE